MGSVLLFLYIFFCLFPQVQEEATPEVPVSPPPEKVDAATQTPVQPPRVLMAEVENITHDKFQITEEVKVCLSFIKMAFLLK